MAAVVGPEVEFNSVSLVYDFKFVTMLHATKCAETNELNFRRFQNVSLVTRGKIKMANHKKKRELKLKLKSPKILW